MELTNEYISLPYLTNGHISDLGSKTTSGLSIVEWTMFATGIGESSYTYPIFGHHRSTAQSDGFCIKLKNYTGDLYIEHGFGTLELSSIIENNKIYQCILSPESFVLNTLSSEGKITNTLYFPVDSSTNISNNEKDGLFMTWGKFSTGGFGGTSADGNHKVHLLNITIKRKTAVGSKIINTEFDLIPCMRLSDSKIGLFNKINGNFIYDSGNSTFNKNLKISQAVNAQSFCNYVVKQCRYFNGSELSNENKEQLFYYLLEGYHPLQLLSIQTALNILNKINTYADIAKTISVSDGSLSSPLSYKTAQTLVSKAFPIENRSKFYRFDQIYDTTGNLNSYNYRAWSFYMPAAADFGSRDLTGYLYGGGGGGSGAAAGDGDKYSSYTVVTGSGAAGGKSIIKYDGVEYYSVSGGDSTGSFAYTVGGNPQLHENGRNGKSAVIGDAVVVNGIVVTASTGKFIAVTIAPLKNIQIIPGEGGGGGGGIAISTGNNEHFEASSGSGVVGGNGRGRCDWSDDVCVGCGGGGGGKHSGKCGTGGTTQQQGPFRTDLGFNTVYNTYVYTTNGKGGFGSYSNMGDNPQNSNALGAGGSGGRVHYSVDNLAIANGGNGGNCGGLQLAQTTCTAASVLLIGEEMNI